jgi:hypothetical protein
MDLARTLGKAALGCFALALLLVGAWAVQKDLAALVFAGFAVVLAILGLVLAGFAVVAAALRRGSLPRWASGLCGVAFAGATALSAAGLAYSGTPLVVGVALVGSLAGVAASARAWQVAKPA